MSIVVLDFFQRKVKPLGKFHCIVSRVHIADYVLRCCFQKLAHTLHRLLKRLYSADISHITHIGREIIKASLSDTERIFKLTAYGKGLTIITAGSHNWQWGISPGTPYDIRLALKGVHNSIV